ncbi:MAG: hypothetical protein H6740_21030 [Alphaproteobacteria bacterium]|nr:hypothetical protein [Alphaproteobacteria bacterium]
MTEQRFEELMVKVADGAASADEERELSAWLADNPEAAAELERHKELVALSRGWIERLQVDVVQDAQAARPAARLEQRLGVTLIVLGLCLLSAFGVVEAMMDPEAPLWLRIGFGLSGAGFLILLFQVGRQRLEALKSDRYEEVIR